MGKGYSAHPSVKTHFVKICFQEKGIRKCWNCRGLPNAGCAFWVMSLFQIHNHCMKINFSFSKPWHRIVEDIKDIYFQLTIFYTHKIQFTAQKNSVFSISQPGRAEQGLTALGNIQGSFFILNSNVGFQCIKCTDFPIKLTFSPKISIFFLGVPVFPSFHFKEHQEQMMEWIWWRFHQRHCHGLTTNEWHKPGSLWALVNPNCQFSPFQEQMNVISMHLTR